MPHPVAETGDCESCGKRGLLYLSNWHGVALQHRACRQCVDNSGGKEYGTAAAHAQPFHGLQQQEPQQFPAMQATFGFCKPQVLYADENTAFNTIAAIGSKRHAISLLCRDAQDRLCHAKAANGALCGGGIREEPLCDSSQFQFSSPCKRQRTAPPFSAEA
mmetsp:Transcript_10588/g.25099  ORF Transcript_10588/g.25099 Transcript_10588/m.25099 type:complete len:161 (-) Transcript_10588:183-665(-)|eukprot:711525-Rhodomonas_salina.5